MDTLIDIFNNTLKYNKEHITIIIDNNNMPWFSASSITKILQYSDGDDAIRRHVDKSDKTTFRKLKKFMNNVPAYSKPHSIFINEFGLYSILLGSDMPAAKKFKRWVITEVLPSIRKTGSYHIEEKYQKQLDKLNEEINELRDELDDNNNKLKEARRNIRILKHNQKKPHHQITGTIYVMRPIDSTNKKLLKAGKTRNLNKRKRTLNTTVPNNMELLFELHVDDPDAVESCMKGLMHKYIYREGREYYETTLKKLRETIIKCDKLIHDNYHCDQCQSRVTSIAHFYDEYDINDNDQLFVNLESDQLGGANEEVLAELPIENLVAFEKYCQINLDPYIDRNNNILYECRTDKINESLHKCNECIDKKLIINTDPSEVVLIDISNSEQKGGSPRLSPEEFNKKIIVMDGGGFILPNGAVVYPNGKVICPKEKAEFNQNGGYVNEFSLCNEINNQHG